MSSSPLPEIPDQENLYRGIHSTQWNEEESRPSSAAFKDRRGLSVDRCNLRDEEDVINFLLSKKPHRGIVKISVPYARELPSMVVYAPVDGNIYHSELHNDEDKLELARGKAKRLAKDSEVVFE